MISHDFCPYMFVYFMKRLFYPNSLGNIRTDTAMAQWNDKYVLKCKLKFDSREKFNPNSIYADAVHAAYILFTFINCHVSWNVIIFYAMFIIIIIIIIITKKLNFFTFL